MIANDQELPVALERIVEFHRQESHLRRVETNPANYHAAASGFLSEIAQMQSEAREYLSFHPAESLTQNEQFADEVNPEPSNRCDR